MSVKLRQELEKKIARRLIKDGLAAGYLLNVNNGGVENELPSPSTKARDILVAMFATDDEHLMFYKNGKHVGWVWFVYGNDGYDVISDYTTNLEHIMSGVNKISENYW